MTIAKARTVTEGSIFRLFGNKAGLWKRCLAQRVAESFSAEAFARSLKGESFEERIRRGVAHLWKTPKSADLRLVNYAMLETPDLARLPRNQCHQCNDRGDDHPLDRFLSLKASSDLDRFARCSPERLLSLATSAQ
jgi:AcrR family transcriptional regulator